MCLLDKTKEEMSRSHPEWCKNCDREKRREYEFKKTGIVPPRKIRWQGDWKTCSGCGVFKHKDDYAFRKTPKGKTVRNSVCRDCLLDYQRELKKDPDAKIRASQSARNHYHNGGGKKKSSDARLRREYGISLAEKEEMVRQNKGLCPLCGSDDPGRYWVVDHCHRTGNIRGVICDKCNKMLGLANDSISRLYGAIRYLSDHYLNQEPVEGVEGVPMPDWLAELEEEAA